jgi:regulator of protease activity HflC (stomatin/prohibitin superfamily)
MAGLPCLINMLRRNPGFPQNNRESKLGKILAVAIISIAMYAYPMTSRYAIGFFFVAMVIVLIRECVRIVPPQHAWVVERLGRFHAVLPPGVNFLIPFVDRVAFRYSLGETALELPEQLYAVTKNVQIPVSVTIYCRVLDPRLASYGCADWLQSITQLAQVTLRSELVAIEPERVSERRDDISRKLVDVLDAAGCTWGVKVLRCEVKTPTQSNWARGLVQ